MVECVGTRKDLRYLHKAGMMDCGIPRSLTIISIRIRPGILSVNHCNDQHVWPIGKSPSSNTNEKRSTRQPFQPRVPQQKKDISQALELGMLVGHSIDCRNDHGLIYEIGL